MKGNALNVKKRKENKIHNRNLKDKLHDGINLISKSSLTIDAQVIGVEHSFNGTDKFRKDHSP